MLYLIKFKYSETTRKNKMKINITNSHLWAIGLIEAEGYIGFNLNSFKKKTWIFTLKVSMKNNNARAIYKLKTILGIGKIHRSVDNMITYKITNREKLKSIIIPLLDTYPLRGKKYYDFIYLKKALNIVELNISQDNKHILLLELKENWNLDKRRISPIYQLPFNIEEKSDLEIIQLISREQLLKLFDSNWIAGFIEGDGSFQINERLQVVFELGQANDTFTVFAIHKYFNISSKIKIRKDFSYTMLSTKHPRVLKDIIKTISGKILGMKSFEFKIWTYAFNTNLLRKKEKAKNLLNKIRK